MFIFTDSTSNNIWWYMTVNDGLLLYYLSGDILFNMEFQLACQCFQSNFDVPRTPNLFKLPQTPNERTILPKLTMTRYGRNLNLKKIQLENSTGKVKLELYIS